MAQVEQVFAVARMELRALQLLRIVCDDCSRLGPPGSWGDEAERPLPEQVAELDKWSPDPAMVRLIAESLADLHAAILEARQFFPCMREALAAVVDRPVTLGSCTASSCCAFVHDTAEDVFKAIVRVVSPRQWLEMLKNPKELPFDPQDPAANWLEACGRVEGLERLDVLDALGSALEAEHERVKGRLRVPAESGAGHAGVAQQHTAGKKVTHSEDFTSVCWFGTTHHFTKGQAPCIRLLWKEWEKGGLGLSELTIGDRIHSDSARFRLSEVFRKGKAPHPAWGTMIQSIEKGTFRLCPPDDV